MRWFWLSETGWPWRFVRTLSPSAAAACRCPRSCAAPLVVVVLAVGAQAPVGDLRLVEAEAARVGGFQAGRLADGAVHVDREPAGAADEVMMVVADARLVARGPAGRLDAAREPGAVQRLADVVRGLDGDAARRPRGRARSPGRRAGGRATASSTASTDDPGRGDAEPGSAQALGELRRRHRCRPYQLSGIVQETVTSFFKNGTTVREEAFVGASSKIGSQCALLALAVDERALALRDARRGARAPARPRARGPCRATSRTRRSEARGAAARGAHAEHVAAPGCPTPAADGGGVEREPARVVPGEAVDAGEAGHRLATSAAASPARRRASRAGRRRRRAHRGAPGPARGSGGPVSVSIA